MIPQAQRETAISAPDETARWSLGTRVALRFFFAYCVLYNYPRAIGSLGAGTNYSNPVRDLWHNLVPWVGANVLQLSGDFREVANGSGDQLYDYVLLFCIAVIAAIATLIWSWVDRKRPNYQTLYQWLRLAIRVVLAIAMITYGADKIFRMQFPELPLAKLIDTYGQSSPMGLLWSFMESSRAYSFFGGVGEMTGGLLLLVPRFTTLGALISLGMMGNVMMLNAFYDVPRKIYSIHLLVMCGFLLLPDAKRLFDLFFLNRKVQLTPPVPLFKDPFLNRGVVLLQLGVGIAAVLSFSYLGHKDAMREATHLPAAIRGIWSVEQFTYDNSTRLPLVTDPERWQRVVFDAPDIVAIQAMNGSIEQYFSEFDVAGSKFTFWKISDPHWRTTFTFDAAHPDRMTLDGQIQGHHVNAELKRVDLSDPNQFLLVNRGIHWVNQFAFRR
jgi:uncharacterized membrane protein YphA (DoxX/SURF4 family)